MNRVSTLALLCCTLALPLVSRADCDKAPNVFQSLNCGFATDTSGWTIVWGTPSWSSDGMPAAGSLELASTPNAVGTQTVQTRSACAPASSISGVEASAAYYHRLLAGPNATCSCSLKFYSDATCTATMPGWNIDFTPSASWTQTTRWNWGTSTGQSVLFDCYCIPASGNSAFSVRFDNFWGSPGTLVPVELQSLSVD